MAKRFVTVTTPDGTVLKRQTAREYSHVLVSRKKEADLGISISGKPIKRWDVHTWIGRPDLVAARVKCAFGVTQTKTGLIKENEWDEFYLLETDK
tara:strand:- start:1 stop:285 length:285 start_codon:yes stop_codon:yes gene_type:complete